MIYQSKRLHNNKVKGKVGEERARQLLESLGYEILEANWRCRLGEMDLIARDRDCLVFVEVKWRVEDLLVSPEENVGYSKQKRLSKLAKLYLARELGYETLARFDVIVIVGERLVHYRNAFPLV